MTCNRERLGSET
uniref:Uncharacterized protein n=1 Tax=Arundo donax TaxID=35708 RepID=A0A0A9H239_ARUDO